MIDPVYGSSSIVTFTETLHLVPNVVRENDVRASALAGVNLRLELVFFLAALRM